MAKSNHRVPAIELLLKANASEYYMYDDVTKVLGEYGY